MGNVRGGINWAVATIGLIVAMALVYVVGVFAFGGAGWITAPFRGEAEKRENTVGSGVFRQSTYEDFFELCASVQTAEGSINALKDEHKTASDTRKAQIDQSVTALKASRNEAIVEYNTKSMQEHRAAFQDKALPYRLDASATETVCELN